jgi:hypothetical protein
LLAVIAVLDVHEIADVVDADDATLNTGALLVVTVCDKSRTDDDPALFE